MGGWEDGRVKMVLWKKIKNSIAEADDTILKLTILVSTS